jgi:hypothetical protein
VAKTIISLFQKSNEVRGAGINDQVGENQSVF